MNDPREEDFIQKLLDLSMPTVDTKDSTILIGVRGYPKLIDLLKSINALDSIKEDIEYENGLHSITFKGRNSESHE
jgi:hypothetical protein